MWAGAEDARCAAICAKISRRQLIPIFDKPAFSRFSQNYAPQTKILEGVTKRCVCVFEVLFNGLCTRFGLPLFENSFKNAYATLCSTFEKSSFGDHKVSTWIHWIVGEMIHRHVIILSCDF